MSDRLTRGRKKLPPIRQVKPVIVTDEEHESLPFSEYKRWLANFRRHSNVTLTPVQPLNQVRCQTATLRLRKRYSKNLKPLSSPRPRIFTVSGKMADSPKLGAGEGKMRIPDTLFLDRGEDREKSGIFDLKALNDALTKPRNKVMPMRQATPSRTRIATIAH